VRSSPDDRAEKPRAVFPPEMDVRRRRRRALLATGAVAVVRRADTGVAAWGSGVSVLDYVFPWRWCDTMAARFTPPRSGGRPA